MSDTREKVLSLLPSFGVPAIVIAVAVAFIGGQSRPTPAPKPSPGADILAAATPTPTNNVTLVPPSAPPRLSHLRFLQELSLYPDEKKLTEHEKAAKPKAATQAEAAIHLQNEVDAFRNAFTNAGSADLVSDYLIVTLPDPIETQFGFWFDQIVDAIQRAMSDAEGFSLHKAWYPWKSVFDASKNPQLRDHLQPADHRVCPGVIVFRKRDDWTRHRVVLIVGENAVNGVHPKAFRNALDLAERKDNKANQLPIRIAGPFFTGGQASVMQGVVEWVQGREDCRSDRWARLLSGSATGLKLVQLESSDKIDVACREAPYTFAEFFRIAELGTTQVANAECNKAALHYLAAPGTTKHDEKFTKEPEGKIAYLVEAGSGFGEGFANDNRYGSFHAYPAAAAAGVASVAALAPKYAPPPPVFRFPMHISRLTGMLSKERRERDERLGLAPVGGFRLTALDELRSGAELLPAADEARTALLNQGILADFWTAIRLERIRTVGIIATDARDKIFLVEQLRKFCPQVQPYIIGHDLHYANPEYAAIMRGTIIVGSYPLIQNLQRWTTVDGRNRRTAFASNNAEGTYNAILALFNHQKLMLDYAVPGAIDKTDSGMPPIWVTGVGEDGRLVPHAIFSNYAPEATHRRSEHVEISRDDEILNFDRFLFGCFFAFLLSLYSGRLLFHYGWPWELTKPEHGRRAQAAVWIVAGLAPMAAVFAASAVHANLTPGEYRVSSSIRSGILWLFLTGILSVLVFTSAFVLDYLVRLLPWFGYRRHLDKLGIKVATVGPKCSSRKRRLGGAVYILAILAAFVAIYGRLLQFVTNMTAEHTVFFDERAGWLFSGTSILVPLLFFAVGLYGYGVLQLRMLGQHVAENNRFPYPERPAGKLTHADSAVYDHFDCIRTLACRLDETICDIGLTAYRRWRLAVALLVPILVAIASIQQRSRPTWEGPAWDQLFLFGFGILALLSTMSALRLYTAWQQVEDILRNAALVPMVGAFDRWPEKISKAMARRVVGGDEQPADAAIAQHLIRRLADFDKGTLKSLEVKLGTIDPDAKNHDELSRRVVKSLVPTWRNAALTSAYGARFNPNREEETKDPEVWTLVAESFVAMQVVAFLSRYFVRLRQLAYLCLVTSVSLLLASTEYPFHPEQWIVYSTVAIVAAVAAVIVWILYRIDRNEIVSRISQSTPDRFSMNSGFLVSFFQLVLPLGLLVAVQTSGRLRSVFVPLLEMFR